MTVSERPGRQDAERLDLVEQLHGHPVADPYRWLEDPATRDQGVVAGAGRALRRAGGRPGRGATPSPAASANCSPPVSSASRCGAAKRQFFMRRNGDQEHAVLLTVDGGRHRARARRPDRARPHRPDDARHLAAQQGGRPARLPALRGRHRGVRAARDRRGHRESRSTARSTAPATPRSPGCPAAQAYYYVRRLDPAGLPGGRGAVPPPGLAAPARHRPRRRTPRSSARPRHRSYYGVSVSRDGRWLVVSAAEGTAPRNDLWIAAARAGDGTPSTPRRRPSPQVAVGLDAHVGPRSAATAGCTSPPTSTRPAAGSR